MQIKHQNSQKEVATMTTEELRQNFLIENIFEKNSVQFVYSHYDRAILGGAFPADKPLNLENYEALKSDFFLERREIGIINIGGNGKIIVDGESFSLEKLDCLYIGKGRNQISFESESNKNPAKYFLMSTPAHHAYPNQLMKAAEATPVKLGSEETSNKRTIYKYIHLDGIKSCQLVLGLTILETGSVWNTMPAHTHDRRMEAYCYFDLPATQRVFHFMGHPQETKHLVVASDQVVISPPWSIHAGCGTSNYSFIWGMAGENQAFTDMDGVEIKDLL